MTAKKCDRCGSYYDEQTKSHLCLKTTDFNDFGNIDLCEECLRDLEYWFNIKNKKSTDEKQKPKKPNLSGDSCDKDGNLIYDTYDCPSCHTSYEIEYEKYDYCPNCGQALDWSEEVNEND